MTTRLARASLLCAMYVVATVLLGPLSYGPVQIRFAAGLYALASLDPVYIIAFGLGTALANLFGGLGPQDVIFGSLITVLTCSVCWYCRSSRIAVLLAIPIVSAPLLGLYLHTLFHLAFVPTMLYIGIGQMIASFVVGPIAFRTLSVLGR